MAGGGALGRIDEDLLVNSEEPVPNDFGGGDPGSIGGGAPGGRAELVNFEKIFLSRFIDS